MYKLIIFALIIPGLSAQTPTPNSPPATQLDRFLARPNVVVSREPTSFGTVPSAAGRESPNKLSIVGLVLRDLQHPEDRAKGVELSFAQNAGTLVDANEVEGFIRAVRAFEENYRDWERRGTCGGKSLTFVSQSGAKLVAHCFAEKPFCMLSGGPYGQTLDADSLKELHRLLGKAGDWLRNQ